MWTTEKIDREDILIRLDKYLCEMEAGTRSEVKAFIKKGRVTVNGETAKSPEQRIRFRWMDTAFPIRNIFIICCISRQAL